jgi:hypothetical protein
MKTFLPALLVVVTLLICLPAAADQRYTVPLENSPSRGPENAPVTIIEFIDFQ